MMEKQSNKKLLYYGGKIIGEIKDGVFKKKIIETKHLLWSRGGVPAINAEVWENNKHLIKVIVVEGEYKKFVIPAETFEENKKEINYRDRQYYCEKGLWEMYDKKESIPQKLIQRSIQQKLV